MLDDSRLTEDNQNSHFVVLEWSIDSIWIYFVLNFVAVIIDIKKLDVFRD